MTQTHLWLEVQPTIPESLKRLDELANDLLYSWEREVRGLFRRLDNNLWEECHHNPRVFLRRVSEERLLDASVDSKFLDDYARVLFGYDSYHSDSTRTELSLVFEPGRDLVAYFCAEFGLYESFPIYSGGLGILAGDHCKAASDLNLPFIAVGLLYRQGYFTQTIDSHGNQIAHYTPIRFEDLPVRQATDDNGAPLRLEIDLPGRVLQLNIWLARAGRIDMVLLDSDLPANSEADRAITYQLYGGDSHNRLLQEIVLGIGGVRALQRLGHKPNVWHINEGHAAFSILERCRHHVQQGLPFDAALELVATGTVFTTHTPVPAGHDLFDEGMMREHFNAYSGELGLSMDDFLKLGSYGSEGGPFNQTALALHGSRHHNGVSAIHGRVAARMEQRAWSEIPAEENPMTHITNGVHVPTFLAREWANLFDMQFSAGWRSKLLSHDYWKRLTTIPDHVFWSVRLTLKATLLAEVRERCARQYRRNGLGQARIDRLLRFIDPARPDILTLGFARRFATYKRATLLFENPAQLAALLNDPDRPVVLLFAGKAHPRDQPGQELIRQIQQYAQQPEFEGRVILLEGYDMALARKLVSGVDVWINNPEYPLEACGTSGIKAAINGVPNLSVLDGWWGEAYDGGNGWAITPHEPGTDPAYRNREEAREMLELLEERIAPLYYERGAHGTPDGWVEVSKRSMSTLIPRFNAQRMLMDYVMKSYAPANWQRKKLAENDMAGARELAAWKRRIHGAWSGVQLRLVETPPGEVRSGSPVNLCVEVTLNGLQADDVAVECLIGRVSEEGEFRVVERHPLLPDDGGDAVTHYRCDPTAKLSGLLQLRIRAYPYHSLLSHPFETGRMIWA